MVRRERGIALALVLMVMVVVSALIAGLLFGGTQEQRVADNTRNAEQAFGTAESGAHEVVRMWSPTRMSSHGSVGTDSILVADSLSPWQTGRYSGTVHKLNNDLYLIDVTGRDSVGLRPAIRGDVPARSRQALLVRVRSVSFPAPPGKAAVTVGDSGIKINGSSRVSGYDSIPPTWTGCPPPDSVIGVLSSGTINTKNGQRNGVQGVPPTDSTPALVDSNFTIFGGATYNQLASAATITLGAGSYNSGPVVTNGACDIGNRLNWGDGDHTQPCGSYYPIVHITGDATLTGTGQGVMLIDGNLNLSGNVRLFGVLIVQGAVKAAGGGGNKVDATLWGIALIRGGIDESNINGNINFQYSKCGLTQALDATSVVAIARSRGWSQLH